jgi:hypothetical protein
MNKQEIINKIAKSKGFHHAEYLCKWDGYEVYSVRMGIDDGDEPPIVGLPVFILVDAHGEIRASKGDEWKLILDSLPNE